MHFKSQSSQSYCKSSLVKVKILRVVSRLSLCSETQLKYWAYKSLKKSKKKKNGL